MEASVDHIVAENEKGDLVRKRQGHIARKNFVVSLADTPALEYYYLLNINHLLNIITSIAVTLQSPSPNSKEGAMSILHFLATWYRQLHRRRSKNQTYHTRRWRVSCCLALEHLEDRLVPSTIFVDQDEPIFR